MGEMIVSKKVRLLKMFAIVSVVLSITEILFYSGYAIYEGEMPSNYLVYLKCLLVFSDIILAITVLRLIRQYYPPKELSKKVQYTFLGTAYFSVFGLVIYIVFIYALLDFLTVDITVTTEVPDLEDIFLSTLFSSIILIKILSVVFTQINGFRLIKEMRKNYRDSLVETSDLL